MKSPASSRCVVAFLALALLLMTGCTKRAKASRHLQRANGYFAANQYDRAEIEYLNVLRLQPTNLVALRNLGDIYYANESYTRAAAYFAAVKKRDPNDADTRGKLARLFLSTGASKEARAEVDAVLPLSPTNENALLVLAELGSKPEELKTNQQRIAMLQQKTGERPIFHIAQGLIARKEKNPAAAESEFKAAAALDPKAALPQLFLGGLYAELGSNTLAEAYLKNASDLSPLRSQNRLRYATFKGQVSGIDAAKPIVSEITSKAPDYVPAWLFSARLALAQTNYTECAADIKRALDRDAINFDAMMLRSELESAQGKFDDAAKTLEKLADIFTRNPAVRYQLALIHLRAKDQTRATVALNQAVAVEPNYAPAVLLLAELNIRKGESPVAIDALQRLTKTYPQLERAHLLLGSAYVTAGRYPEAINVFNQALQKFPRNPDIPHLIGATLKQQGRLGESRSLFDKLVQSNPDDHVAVMELVALDIQENKPDDAAKRLQAWSDRSPKDSAPVFELAKLRYSQKDPKTAQALLEKVLAMNPNAVGAYILLGRIYFDSNQLDTALEKSNAALGKNPNDTGALLLTAIIHENKKNYTAARDTYEKLLAIAPNQVIALNNLAAIYAERLNQIDKAYPLARKAQELAAESPQFSASVNDTFGWILSLRGEYDAAIPLMKEAARQQPTEPEILGHLGLTQYIVGDEVGARASFESALKLSPDFNRRDQVQQSLAILNINPASIKPDEIALLEKRLQEKPADPAALSRLSVAYEKSRQIGKAIAIYEKALAANPKLALAAARLAELEDRNQNAAKALELAKNARKLDAVSPEIAHIAGRLASKSSDLAEEQWGLNLLQESSQKLPGDPSIAHDLAWAYYIQGRVSTAESAMKTSLRSTDPQLSADAKRFLDFLPLSDPSRATQSQAEIANALNADPNYLPALAARAAAEQQKNDVNGALKTLDQILSRYPGFTPAIRNYVVLSANQPADAAKSLAMANRVRENFRDDADFTKALGILQYHRADYPAAIRTLTDASKKRPNDETIYYYLGLSHYKIKQPKETKVALRKAIDLQPKAAFASEVERILNELK